MKQIKMGSISDWKKLYNKLSVSLALIGLSIALAGCGFNKKPTKVDEGMSFIQNLDYESAMSCFEQAIVDGEDLKLIYRGYGIAYMGQGEYEKAIENFIKALGHSNGRIEDVDYDINYYLACAYAKAEQYEEAIRCYDAVTALDDNRRDAFYLRGVCKFKLGDDEGGLNDVTRALELSGEDYDFLVTAYEELKDHGYREIGDGYMSIALESDSKAMTDYQRGRIYFYMEDYENARSYLEKSRDTKAYEVYLYLGKTYEALGDYNYAISVYTTYLQLDQSHPEIYNQLGLCNMRMSDYSSALNAFESGMKIENNDLMQTLAFNEIVAYEYLGEYKQASVLMNNYVKTYPDDEEAKREYLFLKSR